ncbi:class I SAM-dependent methyltransferase [Marilutibacter alkalisoli]|uniref:Class I SAM-dependent methyltransferase n=1 Tax=Marilutibacter alkalisoli TaxID=2591633 RepID=A0A514BT29_9GAMM|nr:class I SAM-dependent methyltransferase [Lysobacter alkalisoli]QDH70546.1 class I SAM-dependent methyltransferase [Lysobacter alkalisoli]
MRQPEQSGPGWFAGPAAEALLAAETRAMERVLVGVPALPWLWVGGDGAEYPGSESRRGVHLARTRRGFGGDLHCVLPWPLVSETFGAVLLQHAFDGREDTGALLGECMRILAPGGVLWLAGLNPWSPYRARWWRAGLSAHGPGYWQSALARAGFPAGAVSLQWLGPRWRLDDDGAGIGAADRLRAGIALTVSKRVHAGIPPDPVRRLRLQTGLGSARTHAGALRQGPGPKP